jgi:hypothetical protein
MGRSQDRKKKSGSSKNKAADESQPSNSGAQSCAQVEHAERKEVAEASEADHNAGARGQLNFLSLGLPGDELPSVIPVQEQGLIEEIRETLSRSRLQSSDNDAEEAETFTPPWSSVSFSCGGWLQFYLFGVSRAFQATGLDKNIKILGCSAGALAAAGLAYEGDFDAAVNFCKKECIPRAHNELTGLFKLHEYVSSATEKFVLPNWKKLEPGTLQIAITKFPSGEAIRVVDHVSQADLRDSLLCSAAAYPLAPLHSHSRYGLCIDGGLSDFQPLVDENTITVSPFYFSDCDIRPSRYVPPWWALIPPRDEDTVDWQYDLGFQDAMRFIRNREIAASPNAKSHLAEPFIRKTSHPFDTPRKITMHRFLGYNYSGVTHNLVNFFMDLGLLLCFMLILKPLALLAIYIELFVRFVVGGLWLLLVVMLMPAVPAILSAFNFFADRLKPKAVVLLESALQDFLRTSSEERATAVSDKLHCILSLSLLLRFLPGSFNRGSSVYLRKHDKLYKHSLLYRILRHVI